MARLLRRLFLLAALGALAAWLKQVLDQAELPAQETEAGPSRVEPPSENAEPPSETPAASRPSGGEPTKAELYERAQELGVKGRSKMSKAELLRAIQRTG
jgi:hypothetical protein